MRRTHHSEGPAIVTVDIAPFEDYDLENPDGDRYDNLDDVGDQLVEGYLLVVEFEAHLGGSSPFICYALVVVGASPECQRKYSILYAGGGWIL